MSSGLPDYYRGVDIAYQALAQMIVRPKYGGAESVALNVTASANETITLMSVSGRGMIYGGTLGALGSVGTVGNIPIIEIDGEEISSASFSVLNALSMNRESSHPFYLIHFDAPGDIYAVAIPRGITFESSFKIKYTENNGTTPTLTTRVFYALI